MVNNLTKPRFSTVLTVASEQAKLERYIDQKDLRSAA